MWHVWRPTMVLLELEKTASRECFCHAALSGSFTIFLSVDHPCHSAVLLYWLCSGEKCPISRREDITLTASDCRRCHTFSYKHYDCGILSHPWPLSNTFDAYADPDSFGNAYCEHDPHVNDQSFPYGYPCSE